MLKAPSKQRGRDFAIMLSSLNNCGYSVEWRVINASEYGRRQRRRRVYFFIFRNDTSYGQHVSKRLHNNVLNVENSTKYILESGLFAKEFPVKHLFYLEFLIHLLMILPLNNLDKENRQQ